MRILVVLAAFVSVVISCSHLSKLTTRKPASTFSPIEVVLEMQKEGSSKPFVTLHPLHNQNATNYSHYSYSNIYDYLSIPHQNPNKQDQCFLFVDKFKKGEIMLPQRSQILSLAARLLKTDDLKNKKPSIIMQLQVEEPKKIFNQNGRLWAVNHFSIKAPHIKALAPIDCKSFDEEKMYPVLQNLITQLSHNAGPATPTTQSK